MEIKVSRDIRKFKTKDIGNFSIKEAGYIAAGIATAFITYKLTGKNIELAIFPLGIILIFGFFKPYGLSFWQFLKTVIKESVTTQCYINETDFQYNADEFKELYGEDVVIPSGWSVIQTPPTKIDKKDLEKLLLV